jgi:hypothetical protein
MLMKRKSKISLAGAICALAMAVGAPVAGAQSASEQGYDESGLLGSVEQEGGGPGAAVVSDEGGGGGGALPFTGLDVGILLALGGAAAGTGYALRRVVRQPAR